MTERARQYLNEIDGTPQEFYFHLIATLHAPAYRAENAGALRQDWPRVPLPMTATVLRRGAAVWRQLAALLDPEITVPGVTDLQVREELKGLGELTVVSSATQKNAPPDLDLLPGGAMVARMALSWPDLVVLRQGHAATVFLTST